MQRHHLRVAAPIFDEVERIGRELAHARVVAVAQRDAAEPDERQRLELAIAQLARELQRLLVERERPRTVTGPERRDALSVKLDRAIFQCWSILADVQ
ncbi:MAG TPA: hypothetical protein VFB69_05345 [Candidatus Dormibacteraeota bacterium]|nr:hypothetical protein [Candidatus Dormibacteraeota bacterium]